MYYYEAYKKFQDQHLSGLKSITQKTVIPSVSVIKEPNGKLQITSLSFKAFFNEKGKLIHLNNLIPRADNKFSYYYDSQYRLVKVIEIDKKSNFLIRENNIKYQDKLNFVEYIREYIDKSYENIREIHHSKEYDAICVEQKNVSNDEWYLNQIIKYDNFIEELHDSFSDFRWVFISELNKNNQVLKSFDLKIDYDEYGEAKEPDNKFQPKEYCMYDYYRNGLEKSISYISEDPWKKTFDYKFNEKGHWIEKVTCIDNSLQFITKRTLEYYE